MKPILILVLLFASNLAFAQIFSSKRVVLNLNGANSVFAADIDGDGYQDILYASDEENLVGWSKNLNGTGSFQEMPLISGSTMGAFDVIACDIDGDLDMDVVSASSDDNKIAWYENIDGTGIFGPQQIISGSLTGAKSVCSSDLDGDNDLDIIAGASSGGRLVWFENLDGEGTFGLENQIDDGMLFVGQIKTADFDGDGDNDIVIPSVFTWHENSDGYGAFDYQHPITLTGDFSTSYFPADIDGDYDIDVVSSSSSISGAAISWNPNIGGIGQFCNNNIIVPMVSATSIYVCDLDNDSDNDVLVATTGIGCLFWVENLDGLGTFGDTSVIETFSKYITEITVADLNNDGDLDIICAGDNNDKVYWHENNPLANIPNQPFNEHKCLDDYGLQFELNAEDYVSMQWQMDDGSGFTDIPNEPPFNFVNTEVICIYDYVNNYANIKFRCIVYGHFSDSIISDTVQMILHEVAEFDLGNDTVLCDGQELVLTVDVGPLYYFHWSNDTYANTISVTEPGIYHVTVSSYPCPAAKDTIQIDFLFPYSEQICMVTVDTSVNRNLIIWEKTENVNTDYYKIYRLNGSAEYDSIGFVDFESLSVFEDSFADPLVQSWTYKITTVDTCGNESKLDDCVPHSTIYLNGYPLDYNTNVLSWSGYEGFIPADYRILRAVENGNFNEIDFVDSGTNDYFDYHYLEDSLSYIVYASRENFCELSGEFFYHQSFSNRSFDFSTDNNSINKENYRIWPNPSKDILNVTFDGVNVCKIEVFSLDGQLRYQSEFSKSRKINVSEWEDNQYIIRIISKKGVYIEKLIVY